MLYLFFSFLKPALFKFYSSKLVKDKTGVDK